MMLGFITYYILAVTAILVLFWFLKRITQEVDIFTKKSITDKFSKYTL